MARYEAYGEYDVKYVDDLDSTFVGFNNRARPDSLSPGMLQEANNFRFKKEGVAQVRNGIKVSKAPLTLSSNTAFTLPFYVYGIPDDSTTTSNNLSTSSVTRLSTTSIQLDFATDHNVVNLTRMFVDTIPGLTGFTAGNYQAVVNTPTRITINDTAATFGGTASGQTSIGAQQLQDTIITQVYGSALFEDPKATGSPYIILAGNTKAVAVNVNRLEGIDRSGTPDSFDILYDSGAIQIGESCDLIQAFNRVYLFREGKTTLEWNGDLTGTPNFTKVPNGSFTQPKLLGSSGNTVIEDGKVTVSETAHNLDNGQEIVIIDKGSSGLVVGDTYRVNVDSVNQFHFFAEVSDLTSHKVEYMGRLPAGGGYIHMPASEYGVFHNDRMVLPFTYNDASTPVSRDILDEVLFSQAEQPGVYDPVFGKSRLNQGGDDRIKGIFSFTEDKLLVFMRDSIYSFSSTTNLKNMVKTLLTSELGLVARKSIVQVGNQIIFLSDNGVYGLSFQDLYNLRGNDTPLSEPIQNTIDNINRASYDKSIAVYFDNRYYIAVPLLNEAPGVGGFYPSNVNTILIFNFLNGQWESVDTVGETDTNGNFVNWNIDNLIVVGDGDARGVYVVNDLGGLHRIDANESGSDDSVVTRIGGGTQSVPIEAKMRTRQFNFKDIQRKKWNTFELQLESSENSTSDANITFTTENADDVMDLGPISGSRFLGAELDRNEDVSIRGRIGNRRAYGCDCTVEVTSGKPKIKVIKVTGGLSFNSTQEIK
jgi:hypothetical protein